MDHLLTDDPVLIDAGHFPLHRHPTGTELATLDEGAQALRHLRDAGHPAQLVLCVGDIAQRRWQRLPDVVLDRLPSDATVVGESVWRNLGKGLFDRWRRRAGPTYPARGFHILGRRGNARSVLISDALLDEEQPWAGILGTTGAPLCPLVFAGRHVWAARRGFHRVLAFYDPLDDGAIAKKQLHGVHLATALDADLGTACVLVRPGRAPVRWNRGSFEGPGESSVDELLEEVQQRTGGALGGPWPASP